MALNSIVTTLIHSYAWFGLAGSLFIMLVMLITGLFYSGGRGERYSIVNHYISELGEVGVSRLSWLFNGGLILGSLVLIPFLTGMGLVLANVWGRVAMVAGILMALSCMAVGLLPMNHIKPHSIAALTYFRIGLVTILLFSVAVFVQVPGAVVIPKISNLAGLFSVVCYAAFLIDQDRVKREAAQQAPLDPGVEKVRPRFSTVTILEWAVFFSTILWFMLVALAALLG